MDRPIEKKSFIRRYALYIAAAVAVVALLTWIVFGSTASTMTVERADGSRSGTGELGVRAV